MALDRLVREICVPLAEYPHIGIDTTLRDAIAALLAGLERGRRYRHVLVLSATHELVGVLGMRDILHGLLPDYLRSGELGHHAEGSLPDFPALTLIWAETSRLQCKEAATRLVCDFMRPVPARVGLDDPLTKAAYLMILHDISMLPVTDGVRLAGVVRMIDVFHEAARAVLDD
ncbi:MAG: CBS domain-containing protein [Thiobacillaceae bacterium]|nr:CBS domain-containing protein [Thiobacillaceae bacterium]